MGKLKTKLADLVELAAEYPALPFFPGPKGAAAPLHKARVARPCYTEQRIDATLMDSFPASDPPCWWG